MSMWTSTNTIGKPNLLGCQTTDGTKPMKSCMSRTILSFDLPRTEMMNIDTEQIYNANFAFGKTKNMPNFYELKIGAEYYCPNRVEYSDPGSTKAERRVWFRSISNLNKDMHTHAL